MKKNATRWRLILLVMLVAFTFYFLYLVRTILPTFILAALLAYILNPIVNWLEKNHIKRTVAILLIYFTVSSMFLLSIVWGFPVIVRELQDFIEAIPTFTEQIRMFVGGVQDRYERIDLPESIRQVVDETIGEVERLIVSIFRQFADGIISLFSQIFYFVIAPVLAFYLLKDWESLEKRFFRLLPLGWREDVAKVGTEINTVMKKFIRGHLLVAIFVGALTAIGLTILGVEFALTLGIIAGVTDLIPYFGPIMGALPAVLVGLLESSSLAIKILILMVVIQQLESNVISPKILGDSVGLHPFTIIFVVLTGGHLFGIIGILLAVPFIAICRTIVIYAYEKLVD